MPVFLIVVLLGLSAASALAAECSVDAQWRKRAPDTPPHHGVYSSLLSQGDALAELPLGVGHLHAGLENSLSAWLDKVTLPLSPAPGERATHLIINGWLIDRLGAGEALPYAGLIETEYEQSSILVEQEQDGWYQIRVRPPGEFPGEEMETGWVPACAMANNSPPLRFSTWENWLMGEHISPLYFRRKSVHNLRTGPGTQFARRGRISGDHVLRPRSIRGDWMEVMVSQPSNYCAQVPVERKMGWIRWRSDERGPWVWYYTRGC